MITDECFRSSTKLMCKIMDTYSGDTTLKTLKFVSTDERYKAVQKIFDRNLPEAEFLKELEKMGA